MNAIDTNVLVYGIDTRDLQKHQVATQLIGRLDRAVIPWQVACEFLSKARKLGLAEADVWSYFDRLMAVHVLVVPSKAVMNTTKLLVLDSAIQFWDALIYAACIEAGVTRIYSEDLPGKKVEGLEIVNPFA